jgi:hypothetical protein
MKRIASTVFLLGVMVLFSGQGFQAFQAYVASYGNYVNVQNSGIVTGRGQSNATRIANGATLQSIFNGAAGNNATIVLPCQPIEYVAQNTSGGLNVGLQVPGLAHGIIGCGARGGSVLIQYATNFPCLTLGDVTSDGSKGNFSGIYAGIVCSFGVDQSAQTQGHCFVLGRIAYAKFEDLECNAFGAGGGRIEAYDAMIQPSNNGLGFFENQLNNINLLSAANTFLELDGVSSGNNFGWVYIGGSANQFNCTPIPSCTDYRTPAGYAINFGNQGGNVGVFTELNVEWIKTSGANCCLILFNDIRGVVINQLRLEGDRLVGANACAVGLTQSNVVMNRFDMFDVSILTGDVTGGAAAIFCAYDQSRLTVGGVSWQWAQFGAGNGGDATNAFVAFSGGVGTSGNTRQRIEIHNAFLQGNVSGTFSFDANTPQINNVIAWEEYNYNPAISSVRGCKIVPPSGTTAFSIGGWCTRPEITVDAALTANLTITWLDTWLGSGIGLQLPTPSPDILTLARDTNATGAFSVLLKNGAGTTITTQATAGLFNQITRNGTTLTNN